MGYRKEAWRRGNRHDLWSKDLFREEVEAGGESLVAICKRWSKDPDHIQGLQNDVRVWRAEDPELDKLCSEKFPAYGGGRPSLELEVPDWRRLYCEEYIKTKSRVQASAVTPYTYEVIRKKLEPSKSEYDPIFVEMLAEAESKLLDRAEQIIHESLDKEESPRNRAWIALNLLKVRDRARFGDKVDISVTGTVQHTLDRGRVLAQLADSQRAFLERQRETLALPEGETIEAEVISSENQE